MAGKTLKELNFTKEVWPKYWAVKESVFPFSRFHGQDILLSPEMRSTGEVMGLDADATLGDVKAKYKALVKQHHPDANGGDRSTEDRLIEIIKAYNYLKTVVRAS